MSLLPGARQREIFWPPADELLEAAERIRARLGDWPSSGAAPRICLAAPTVAGPGDVLVLDLAEQPGDLPQHWLDDGAGVLELTPERVKLRYAHASFELAGSRSDDWLAAWAAFMDCGFAAPDALCLALAWRPEDAADPARADAWPCNLAQFPQVVGLPPAPTPFASCPEALGLYPLVPNAKWVERLLQIGVTTLQLRVKPTDPAFAEPAALDAEIRHAVRVGRAANARVFINDHWREALEAGAYGVHLGQEDLAGADLDALAKGGIRLGLSSHGYYEILVALHFRPSYLALGAVFPTATKTMPSAPQGLARLARYVALLDGVVPLVAIGGIDSQVLPAVLATGVKSAAVVSAITEALDLDAVVAAMRHKFAS